MKVYYRISDNSYLKPKLPGATKKFCLENFLSIFGKEDVLIIADNVGDETFSMIQNLHLNVIRTQLSNAGSLWHAIQLAQQIPDEAIYFVEDDYLHFQGITAFGHRNPVAAIQEGLKFSDYVTLYDHPDKYNSEYNFGETSRCFKTKHSHWRHTISTCMTFSTTSKILRDDIEIWREFTQGQHPHDHLIFDSLKNRKQRCLAVSIPGMACHMDLTYPIQKGIDDFFDDWALNLLETNLKSNAEVTINTDGFVGYKKLLLLEAMVKKSN